MLLVPIELDRGNLFMQNNTRSNASAEVTVTCP
jgi:hypothetical protein